MSQISEKTGGNGAEELKTRIRTAERIASAVAKSGGRAYYVGGFVRDRIMEKEGMKSGASASPDIDIEVHGIEAARLRGILSDFGEVLTVGESFGIFTLGGSGIDIAMPRTEKAVGRGHRDFETFTDPFIGTEKAASRRDFTVNAIMEDILTGQTVDHFDGAGDIKRRLLRHVSTQSFPEDPLRVLRAAQFAARFGFDVDPKTAALCRTVDISSLPGERVEGELKKALLLGDRPSVFFEFLRKTGHLEPFFDELEATCGVEQDPLFHAEGDVFTHTMMVTDEAAGLRERAVRPYPFMLSAVAHDLGKAVTTVKDSGGRIHSYGHDTAGVALAEKMLRRFTNEKSLIRYVGNMTLLHMMPNHLAMQNSSVKATNRMFDRSCEPSDLILLGLADSYGMEHSHPYIDSETFLRERYGVFLETMAKPYVTGNDLTAAGLVPDGRFGELLDFAHKLRLAGVSKEDALRQTLSYARRPPAEKKKR